MKQIKSKAKQSKAKNEVEILTTEIDNFLNEVEEVEILTLTKVLAMNLEDQEQGFKDLKVQNLERVRKTIQDKKERNYFLKGSHQLGFIVYNNSINEVVTTTIDLFKESQLIVNSIGKLVKMKLASFTRTWNNSLSSIEDNIETNNSRSEDEKREIETVRYFDDINETLKVVSTNKRYNKLFNGFTEKRLNEGLDIYVNSIAIEDKNYKFGSYNEILVKSKSLELFKAFLVYKGAKFETDKEFWNNQKIK